MNERFTIPEENLICIYAANSRTEVIGNIQSGFPYMDGDMRRLADAVIRKLHRMTDSDFSQMQFILTDK